MNNEQQINHNPANDGIDGVEGHVIRFRPVAPAEEGDLMGEAEGHAIRQQPNLPADRDGVEGHPFKRGLEPAGEADTDGTEGHPYRRY